MSDSCGPCANERSPGQSELTPTRAEGLFDLASASFAERETQPTPKDLHGSFPQFEIFELLGRGGMGVVYKARQIALDRSVAIKLLPPALGDDPDFAHRFQREARAMARLSHPGIITVHDFGRTPEGRLYFVMEFVEGVNLHELIRSGGLAPLDALSIAAQVCEALAYAHGEGVVHRDIKPANVMVTHCGRVKVADFGLARLIGQEGPSALTMTGTVMGTLQYMAPEQRRGERVDQRADIFALGVVLYEMLCRDVPHGMFDLPSTRVGCDPHIDHIIARAMQSEPERRFQSTQEMHAAIDTARTAILAPVPVAPRALAPPAPPRVLAVPRRPGPPVPAGGAAVVPARRALRRRTLPIAAALAVVAVGGGLYWHFTRPLPPLPPRPEGTGFEAAAASVAAVHDRRTHPAQESAAVIDRRYNAGSALPSAATKDAPFINSLGMKFVPVPITGGPTDGQRVLFSIWETRNQDYGAFAQETQRQWEPWGGKPGRATYPAQILNWENAKAFCAWLTERERKAGRIANDLTYRLPTDHEWSCAVGLGTEDPDESPAVKSRTLNGAFPWGTAWPPPKGAGNLADEVFHYTPEDAETGFIEGYADGFPELAPVGTFPASPLGLYDLAGNVLEWVEDRMDVQLPYRVQRGTGWRDAKETDCRSNRRKAREPFEAGFTEGFRAVLAPASSSPAPGPWTAWRPPPGPPGLVKTFEFREIQDIALLQDDRRLLLLDKHQWLRLVDLASGQTVWHAAASGGRLDVASDDLRVICSGVADGATLKADSIDAQGKTVAQWSTPYPRIASGYTLSTAASPDGKLLCLAIQERHVEEGERTNVVVHVLATGTMKSVAEWQVRPVQGIYSVVWLDTHRFLLSTRHPGDLLAFDLARPGDPPRPHPAQLHFTVGADASGQVLAGSYAGMHLAMTSVRDGFKPMKLREKGVPRVLCFVGTSQLITLGVGGHDLSVFDLRSRTSTREFHLEDYMDQLAVSRDGTFAVMSGQKEGESNRSFAALWRLREIK